MSVLKIIYSYVINPSSIQSERVKNLPKEVLEHTKGWKLTPEEALEKNIRNLRKNIEAIRTFVRTRKYE